MHPRLGDNKKDAYDKDLISVGNFNIDDKSAKWSRSNDNKHIPYSLVLGKLIPDDNYQICHNS